MSEILKKCAQHAATSRLPCVLTKKEFTQLKAELAENPRELLGGYGGFATENNQLDYPNITIRNYHSGVDCTQFTDADWATYPPSFFVITWSHDGQLPKPYHERRKSREKKSKDWFYTDDGAELLDVMLAPGDSRWFGCSDPIPNFSNAFDTAFYETKREDDEFNARVERIRLAKECLGSTSHKGVERVWWQFWRPSRYCKECWVKLDHDDLALHLKAKI